MALHKLKVSLIMKENCQMFALPMKGHSEFKEILKTLVVFTIEKLLWIDLRSWHDTL